MKITIETIPHEYQRYTTAGDWFFTKEPIYDYGDGGPSPSTEKIGEEEVLHIKVSALGDWKREAILAIHELVEVLACKSDGVTQEQVDKFDFAWTDNENEPGDSPDAPYNKQHRLAMGIENIMAMALGVDWQAYEKQLEELPEIPAKNEGNL